MKADFFEKYQSGGREVCEGIPVWDEQRVQRVWFEGWLKQPLETVEGGRLWVVQPGFWRRGAGPDFQKAAVRFPDGSVRCGDVEVDLKPENWTAHEHDENAEYDNVIVHAVWEAGRGGYFTSTKSFTYVPQVVMRTQLAIDEMTLWSVLDEGSPEGWPMSVPGACRREFEQLGRERLVAVLRSAGLYRLRRKGVRFYWRVRAVGGLQTLWEALARGMGYHENVVAFTALAQCARIEEVSKLEGEAREAFLWGMADLLPENATSIRDEEGKRYLKKLWSQWWMMRGEKMGRVLPRDLWVRRGGRPWNHPLRRLAGLCALSYRLEAIYEAIEGCDEKRFIENIVGREDYSFWMRRVSWWGRKLDKAYPLIGRARAVELLVNVFWPWAVWGKDLGGFSEELLESRLLRLRCGWNHKTRIVYDRIVPPSIGRECLGNALMQQGLLQIYEDYCVRDASACASCPFLGQIEAVS
ncbi:MAG: DUF2851 family protein [Methylacidiphilales bacterium]|nr:DUF2851 family protein [Candidatus Methylacidiphilales bacterium]MDW8349255.1 DUF2851 family protein [Verrucomicrobiae bacterium]